MKNKKTLVLGATAKPEKYAFKAITLLVEKGHSVLDWSKCGRSCWNKNSN
jgi:predicted CoA-binding protein